METANLEIRNKILEDIKDAMRAKEALRLDTLRMLNSAIKNREIELRPQALGEKDVMDVLRKLIKQRKESIEQFQAGGRADLAEKEGAELKVLQHYLPAEMSREEIEKIIQSAIAETGAQSVKDMGKVMKLVTAKAQGRADNKVVSELIKAKLGG